MEKKYDVVVCGGGVAGIAAAIASARQGARTAMIEKQCILGGLATSGLIYIYLPLCDGYGNRIGGGIALEMLERCIDYGPFDLPECWGGPAGGNVDQSGFPAKTVGRNGVSVGGNPCAGKTLRLQSCFSPGGFSLSLDKMLKDAGVDLWIDSCICGVETLDGRMTAVNVANESGVTKLTAGCFVDATGSAFAVRQAGGKVGRHDNYVTPWFFEVAEHPERFKFTERVNIRRIGKAKEEFLYGKCNGGWEVSDFVRKNWAMIREAYDALPQEEKRKNYPLQLPAMPLFRKIARIDALYNLTDEDRGGRFEDSVGVVSDWRRPGPVWETPYRALLPRDVKGVLTAGRCIGADGEAWEIFRVIPAAAITGEAAGVAAAQAADRGCDPADVPVQELREELTKRGCIVDAAPHFGVDKGSGNAVENTEE